MILKSVVSSRVDIVRFLAQGIKDPDAKVKIMHKLEQINNNNLFTHKLEKQYKNKVQELKQDKPDSFKQKNNNNGSVNYTNNSLDRYTNFRFDGLRQLLK